MNARDELIQIIWDEAVAERVKSGKDFRNVPVVRPKVEAMADRILAAGYRKPLTIENDKLVIDDGLLLLEVGGCTCTPYGSSHEAGCGYEYLDDLTKPLDRAGYRKPRTITTREELDALPSGSVILGSDGEPNVLHDNGWVLPGGAGGYTSWAVAQGLPATVLHEPEATS